MLILVRFFLITLCMFNSAGADIFTIDDKTLFEAEKDYGVKAKERIVDLTKLLNKINRKTEMEKLEAINNFFNKINFKTDPEVWKEKDYWATRTEFLSVADGDCEDYAIAKYFSLRQLGISSEKIFLTYVKALKPRQAHMVMTYFESPKKPPLILDNLNPKILAATQRRDLHPIFNFNGEKIYRAKQRGLGRVIPSGKVNLSKWTNLILKIKKEKQ